MKLSPMLDKIRNYNYINPQAFESDIVIVSFKKNALFFLPTMSIMNNNYIENNLKTNNQFQISYIVVEDLTILL